MSDNKPVYDFLITDENEVMLVMYARDSAPDAPAARLVPDGHSIEIYRNSHDAVTLQYVDSDVFKSLEGKEFILVCETAPTDDPEETEIVYAYEAPVVE